MRSRVMTATALLGTLALAGSAMAAPNELGLKIYSQKCVSCHGADGKGNPKTAKMLKVQIPALAAGALRTESELMTIISEGKKPMPAYGKTLSKEELEAVVHYVKDLATGAVAGGK